MAGRPPPDPPSASANPDEETPPKRVCETTITRPDGKTLRLVAASPAAAEAVVATLAQLAEHGQPARSAEESQAQLTEVLSTAVGEMCTLLEGHDAFDVMAMLEQFLLPPDLAMWSESQSTVERSWASAEVVALALLGMGLPTRASDNHDRTASIVPPAVAKAAVIVQLSDLAGLNTLSATYQNELATVAWRLRSFETKVRGRQYESIARRINDAILRRPRAAEIWQAELGYTLDDVLRVRTAIAGIKGRAHSTVIEQLAKAAQHRDLEPDDSTRQAALNLFETPSALSTVTLDQVTASSEVAEETARAVLDLFSMHLDGRSPLELISAFVAGRNPMAGKAILRRDGGHYLVLAGAIAPDEIRRTCEATLKVSPAWSSYDRQRARGAEDLAAEAIAKLVNGDGDTWTQLKYRAPSRSGTAVDLSAASTTAGEADLVESDLLLVLDGVALCIETKAGDLREKTRQGGIAQLGGDLKKTVQDAAEQADRLRRLITTHHGLWLADGTWLDLATVQEVHSIVVCLDDFGPAALTLDELVRSGALAQTDLPWIVSLHDLLVCSDVLEEPNHFLTYVRRRGNRDAALWVTAADELDILMWFVDGHFYFEPDPDRVHARAPQGRPPTTKDRRRYADQGRTIVGTFTDDLDAWYYWQEGSSSQPAARPKRMMDPFLRLLCRRLREIKAPGWWRIGADLDGLSDQAQHQLSDSIRLTISRTRADNQFHSCSYGGSDDSGRWVLIAAAAPDAPESRDHLQAYLMAKKHQVRADRALGVMVNADGSPRLTSWYAYPPEPDPALDRLTRQMGLVPPDRMPRVLPPHVRQPRLARKRRRKK